MLFAKWIKKKYQTQMKQENLIKPHNRSAHSKMCIIRTLQSISTDQLVHSYQQLNLTYFKETSFLLMLTFKGIFRDHPPFNIIKKLVSTKKNCWSENHVVKWVLLDWMEFCWMHNLKEKESFKKKPKTRTQQTHLIVDIYIFYCVIQI